MVLVDYKFRGFLLSHNDLLSLAIQTLFLYSDQVSIPQVVIRLTD